MTCIHLLGLSQDIYPCQLVTSFTRDLHDSYLKIFILYRILGLCVTLTGCLQSETRCFSFLASLACLLIGSALQTEHLNRRWLSLLWAEITPLEISTLAHLESAVAVSAYIKVISVSQKLRVYTALKAQFQKCFIKYSCICMIAWCMWEWISLIQSQYQTHSSGGEHRSWLKECYNSLFQAEQTKGYTKAQHRINTDYLNYKE